MREKREAQNSESLHTHTHTRTRTHAHTHTRTHAHTDYSPKLQVKCHTAKNGSGRRLTIMIFDHYLHLHGDELKCIMILFC